MADLIYRWHRSGWRLVLGLALCVMAATVPTRGFGATYQNGNALWKICNEGDTFSNGFCLGYVVAVVDALDANAISVWRACVPKGVSQGQMRDTVVKWLRKSPENRHYEAVDLVALALSENFPCR